MVLNKKLISTAFLVSLAFEFSTTDLSAMLKRGGGDPASAEAAPSTLTPPYRLDVGAAADVAQGHEDAPTPRGISRTDIPVKRIDLDYIEHLAAVPEGRLAEWNREALAAGNFMVVTGVYFLSHSLQGLFRRFPDYYVEGEGLSSYFTLDCILAGFWDNLWLSASLVNPSKYPTAATMGFVLDIPPPLILKTYQHDSMTMVHRDLYPEPDINKYVRDCLKFDDGYYDSEMFTVTRPNGEVEYESRRVFAEGETEDSPAFMTPSEMIARGRPEMRNEIKFVPVGTYRGVEYRVKITGIFYQDKPRGEGMMREEAITDDPETMRKLQEVSAHLNLPLIPLSQER